MRRLGWMVGWVTLLVGACFAGEPEMLATEAVQAIGKDSGWVVVDTRKSGVYNGWTLEDARGGHIPGARNFSAQWLGADDARLNDDLSMRGITPEKKILLYDTNGSDARQVARFLMERGFDNVSLYDAKGWVENASLPLEVLPHYELVVPAHVVKAVMDGERPKEFHGMGRLMVVEASWGPESGSYAKGHLPGAFHINTDLIEPPSKGEPQMWMLAGDKHLAEFALNHGFTRDATVILSSAEPLAAYRVATVLKYIGVEDVRVLDGGDEAWTRAGYTLETKRHEPVAVEDFGGPIPGNPHVMDTLPEVRQSLKSSSTFTLVDNRTWKEHIGADSGYSYHKKAGRIPGSVYGYAGKKNAYSMEYFRNPDNTMREPEVFLKLWKDQGIDVNSHLSFMCGSGWRVAEIYYYAAVAGLKDISIFSDGWIGWSNTPGCPVVTGCP